MELIANVWSNTCQTLNRPSRLLDIPLLAEAIIAPFSTQQHESEGLCPPTKQARQCFSAVVTADAVSRLLVPPGTDAAELFPLPRALRLAPAIRILLL